MSSKLIEIGAKPPGDGDRDLETARACVRERKARTQRYSDAAAAVGVPVSPRAFYELEPRPRDRPAIKARGMIYLAQVRAFRALREFERYALGMRESFPGSEAEWLGLDWVSPELIEPGQEAMALDLARAGYDEILEIGVEDMNARDPDEAARVLDACVRDVESGRRRERVNVVSPWRRPPEILMLPFDEGRPPRAALEQRNGAI